MYLYERLPFHFQVWNGMMGRELARAIDLEPEEILEAARISSPEDRIYNTLLLQELVKGSPFRSRLVRVRTF